MTPYFQDEFVTLYHGDARDIVPRLDRVDMVVADPPYEQTRLAWDKWPAGWPSAISRVASSMWCFGSMRLFMEFQNEFSGWKFAQDIVWEKQNGTGLHNDRFRKVHELVAQFYRGKWADVYKKPVTTNDAKKRKVIRAEKPAHWGRIQQGKYKAEFGDARLLRSVIKVKNCHRAAVHPTQKPLGIIAPLIEYSCPRGGVVLDPFAGSGSTLITAKTLGRRSVGIEQELEFCRVIVDQLRQTIMAV